MSLVKCPECQQEISDQAALCVKCGNPIHSLSEQPSHVKTGWSAVTKAKTPINVFCLAMMACSAILGVSATQVDSDYALTAFTYTLHIFLAVSGMFFATILFCRKGMYHPEDLAKAKQAGVDDLGQDKPIIAAVIIGFMILTYGIYQWLT
ncbi:MAG TPA: hypothetical protein PKK23_19960 [Nitrospirales bacterium]|nr:hypothetical protein [Nitrospiraceae bacterium]HNP31332.1 hypothetical protein [Nitrospirales bacterium]